MIKTAIPIIAMSDSRRSEDYYCRILGFAKRFDYRPDLTKAEPCYMGMVRDGVELHLQSFKRERAGMTDAFIYVDDVDELFAEFSAAGANCQLPPTDQTWGTREIGIRDPDGNALIFATPQKKKG